MGARDVLGERAACRLLDEEANRTDTPSVIDEDRRPEAEVSIFRCDAASDVPVEVAEQRPAHRSTFLRRRRGVRQDVGNVGEVVSHANVLIVGGQRPAALHGKESCVADAVVHADVVA